MTLDRAFLAVPLSQSTCERIAEIQSELAQDIRPLRWAHPETLHLTLHFFGKLSEENLEKVRVSMLSVGFEKKPFQVEIQGLGVFPSRRSPRVLWLGLTPAEHLQSLHRIWYEALFQTGLRLANKTFAPHLTIGRFHRKAHGLETQLDLQADRKFGSLPVDRLVLYESRLTPQRAEHITLETVALQG